MPPARSCSPISCVPFHAKWQLEAVMDVFVVGGGLHHVRDDGDPCRRARGRGTGYLVWAGSKPYAAGTISCYGRRPERRNQGTPVTADRPRQPGTRKRKGRQAGPAAPDQEATPRSG